MYSELIHTRCRDGVDLAKDLALIRGGSIGGFKAFSCSEDLKDNGTVDLAFLNKIQSEKQTYKDPSFMVDAYLYFTPDVGRRFLVNFHPVHFDREDTEGDYPHRPGNFINQIFVGAFDDFYPYETFGNRDVWDAQSHKELYYYETPPRTLPQRKSLGDSVGRITVDRIREFISAGRRDVFLHALSFLIAQYSLPPENRKYLIIRDEDDKALELWVAAFESAFSPRMSSGLPFATRMYKPAEGNKYTVNPNGQFQPTINLQSPTHKLRYRAMIVGVDRRDTESAGSVRVLPSSPFAFLDGAAKTLSEQTDISDPYYSFISAFSDNTVEFCREYLQSFTVGAPGKDVLSLFSAYQSLTEYLNRRSVPSLLSALSILDQYQFLNTRFVSTLYYRLKADFQQILAQNPVGAFKVMSWLSKTASLVGDQAGKDYYKDIVCSLLDTKVYTAPGDPKTAELKKAVSTGAFTADVFRTLTGDNALNRHAEDLKRYQPQDWISLASLFADDVSFFRGGVPAAINTILSCAMEACRRTGDVDKACRLAERYRKVSPALVDDLLLARAEKEQDKSARRFFIDVFLCLNPAITSSNNEMLNVCKVLTKYHLDDCIPSLLAQRASKLRDTQEMSRYLDWISTNPDFKSMALGPILMTLDKKLLFADPNASRLAAQIQRLRPEGTAYVNSAHLYALSALDDKRLTNVLPQTLQGLIEQGFPSAAVEEYAGQLADRILRCEKMPEIVDLLVSAVAGKELYARCLAERAVELAGTRKESMLAVLLESAAVNGKKPLFDAFVTEFASLKRLDRVMSSLRFNVRSKEGVAYLNRIEKAAAEQGPKPGRSIFSFFGRGGSGKP